MATKARLIYTADEDSLQKQRREFSIADELQQKIDSIEEGAQVNTIETIKVNGVALIPDENKAVDIEVPGVIDSLDSTSIDDALSARQGKILYEYIQNLGARGRYLSNWNCATGLPVTNPQENPYIYMTGDYFSVSNVATSPATNYRPDGTQYVAGQASQAVETDTVEVSDFYIYDGANWILLHNSSRTIAVDSSLSTTSTNPVENRVITNAINSKADITYVDAHDTVVSSTAPSNPTQGMVWYDTTNDVLKTYDGTSWTGVGVECNTKTFYLSSTSDLTTAQAALDWYNDGKNPLIIYNNQCYIVRGVSPGHLYFGGQNAGGVQIDNIGYYNLVAQDVIELRSLSGVVQSIYVSLGNITGRFLDPTQNYTNPYIPLYPGSPATKKYVDDNDTYIGTSAPTSNLVEGRLWYDTTNDVLKTYDGTSWTGVGVECNTKTFYFDGTSADDNVARDILAWYLSGKTPIIQEYDSTNGTVMTYTLNGNVINEPTSGITSSVKFYCTYSKETNTVAGYSYLKTYTISIWEENSNIHIQRGYTYSPRYIDAGYDYSTPYTPIYDGSPATKKYVDDSISAIVIPTYVAGPGIEIGQIESYSAMQGPCDDGFHVPSKDEWEDVTTMGRTMGIFGTNQRDVADYTTYLKVPAAGYLYYQSGTITGEGNFLVYWTNTPVQNDTKAYMYGGLITGTGGASATAWEISMGLPVRPFKDIPVEPDSTWTTLLDGSSVATGAGVFWDENEGLISISSDGQTWITLADKNIGATNVGDLGNYFQRGNNNEFISGSVTTSSTAIDTSSYGPSEFSSNTFITAAPWSNPFNDDLWGGTTGIIQADNAIINTGVLSVNGQTGDVVVTDTTYTAGTGINIDTNNEISNTLPGPIISATAPTGTEGALWYDTTNDVLMAYDGTSWKEAGTQMKVLSYGHSTWQDFLDAYNENAIVYCRASSNANPGSGTQGRMAFMAFIDINSSTQAIQGVEFQYYRSRSDHNSAANQLDQVFVYKLTSAGTWTVTERNTGAKAVAGTGISLGWGSGNMTINNTAPFSPGTGTTGQVLTKTESGYEWDDTQGIYTAGEGIAILNGPDYSAMQGPAPAGYHVPSTDENVALVNTLTALGIDTSNGNCMKTYLKMPFAGFRSNSSSDATYQGTSAQYWSSTAANSFAYRLGFSSSELSPQEGRYRAYGSSVRCFKNSPIIPTSSWTTLYAGTGDAGIFHDTVNGLISLSSDGINRITIQDKNLGATMVYNDGDTLSQDNCGNYYQWGNNYGFPWTGSVTTSSTQVDASGYGPGNYYSSSTFITISRSPRDWSSVKNDNLRGGTVIFDNAIANTGVLSVNGQTGDVVVDESNTKTFFLASTSDLTNAQAAYDWSVAGKNPIIIYNNNTYVFERDENQKLYFRCVRDGNVTQPRYTQSTKNIIGLSYDNLGIVTQITSSAMSTDDMKYLRTDVDYQTPYTPQYNGSPATKKYVDDSISAITIPTVNDATLTVTQNGVSVGTFTANASNNTTIALTDTTYTAGEGIAILNGPDYSAMKGPAPVGYHIPSKNENASLVSTLTALGIDTSNGNCMKTYLKMPFAGDRSRVTTTVGFQGDSGHYWSATAQNNNGYVYGLFFDSNGLHSQIGLELSNASSLRCFKDSPVIPTSSWTTLFDGSSVANNAGIFHDATNGLISLSSDGTNWITIQDKNLGATTVYNDGDTLSQANCGNHYQRGNNYGFPWTGSVTSSSTKVDTSSYGPGNYYNDSTFIVVTGLPYDWSSAANNNLWGGVTGVVTRSNAITNTGVLSVNGLTGDVTVEGLTYTAGTGISINSSSVISNTGVTSVNGQVGDVSVDESTKTFYLSSTSDLTTAQDVLDWCLAGKNAIIILTTDNDGGISRGTYLFRNNSGNSLTFYQSVISENDGATHTAITNAFLQIDYSTDTVTQVRRIGPDTQYQVGVLATGCNYATPYTPEYAGSPATKKYVDDSISAITIPTYTAGTNVSIDANNVISATDTTYIAGTGINISDYADYSAMRGPAPEGYHVPSVGEFRQIRDILDDLGIDSSAINSLKTYLKLPSAGALLQYGVYFRGDDNSGFSYRACTATTNHNVQYADQLDYRNSTVYYDDNSGRGNCIPIRAFKDNPVIPNAQWTVLYDGSAIATGAGIFHSSTLGLISLSSDGQNRLTIADKNLGATAVYNSGDTLTDNNCGGYFQWGNNYMFPGARPESIISTPIDASGYGPGNYYSSSDYYYVNNSDNDWDSTHNKNLRGGVTGIVQLQNIITNTGVLSVNGQTGHVTVQSGGGGVLIGGETLADKGTNFANYLNSINFTPNAAESIGFVGILDGRPYYLQDMYYITQDVQYRFVFESLATSSSTTSNQSSRIYHGLRRIVLDYDSTHETWSYNSSDSSYITTTMDKVLRIDQDYSSPYMPLYDGSPATKKYVDSKIVASSTSPSSPAEGMLWYDTTNDTLYSYDGSNRQIVGSGGGSSVQSNWTQTDSTAADYIKNKPNLATVATSGSYNDLSNKPTIPTVYNGTLTIQKNGTTVDTFTANSSSNKTVNITVPTTTSELTNNSGFITSSSIPSVGNGTITIKQGGVQKGTFTTNQSGNTTINLDAGGGAERYVQGGTRCLVHSVVNNDGTSEGFYIGGENRDWAVANISFFCSSSSTQFEGHIHLAPFSFSSVYKSYNSSGTNVSYDYDNDIDFSSFQRVCTIRKAGDTSKYLFVNIKTSGNKIYIESGNRLGESATFYYTVGGVYGDLTY